MPTEKPRVTITISEEQLKQVDDYRYSNKMKNQTQAILSLVKKGLDSIDHDCANDDERGKPIRIPSKGKYERIIEKLNKLTSVQISRVEGFIDCIVMENEAVNATE